MNRLLLSQLTHTTSLLSQLEHDVVDAVSGHDVSHDSHDPDTAFLHVYYVMLFVSALWFVGALFQKLGMPALVGEIIMGIVMGPNAFNLVGNHGSEFLIVIGEIGLIMLVVEAGIDVDIGMLKLIGPRGLAIAILGSVIPTLMGVLLSIAMGEPIKAAIAIGSCFAPTSMGIALNVLKKAKILNTPTGQLIIAAAILDDVIALIILSELSAMNDPTALNIILPLVVSPVLILIVGYLSIRWIPRGIKKIMSKIPAQHHQNSILLLLFLMTFLMIPGCHFVGSSYLLGAFLSGMMFCTDHTIHHVWSAQIKRILYWMLRIFFACTIGFAIPIKEFRSMKVITRGLLYCLCGIGKIITGVFGRPMRKKEFLTVGFSMSAWGEFAFILATASYAEGTFEKEAFSAVLLAVLLSVIISPYCLRLTLTYFEKQTQKKMNANLTKYKGSNLHPVYFAINTRARGGWGHQDKILHSIFALQLEIIDFRSWHAPEFNYSHHQPLTKESFYVEDHNVLLPPTKHLSEIQNNELRDRVKMIRMKLRSILGDKAIINIKRWLPGVLKDDDKVDKSDLVFGQHVPKTLRRASYCRREAFKQAHSIMSSVDLTFNQQITIPTMTPQRDIPRTPSDPFLMENERVVSTPDIVTASNPFPVPAQPMTRAKSDGIEIKPPAHHLLKLRYRTSDPELFGGTHSGAGHGGQAKGVGALPWTNATINIYDHWDEQQARYRRPSQFIREQGSDDEVSYLYGDEDAEHHKLPMYTHPDVRRPKAYSLGDLADNTHSSIHYHHRSSGKMQATIYENNKDPDLVDEDEDFDTDANFELDEDGKPKKESLDSSEVIDPALIYDHHQSNTVHIADVHAGQSNGATVSVTPTSEHKLVMKITSEKAGAEPIPIDTTIPFNQSHDQISVKSASPSPAVSDNGHHPHFHE